MPQFHHPVIMFSNLLAIPDHAIRFTLCAVLFALVASGAAHGGWAFFGCALLSLVILDTHASLAAMRKESDAEQLLQVVDRQNVALADCLRLAKLLREAMRARSHSVEKRGGKRAMVLKGGAFCRSEGDLMKDLEGGGDRFA